MRGFPYLIWFQLRMGLMCARSCLNEKKWSRDVTEPLGLWSGVGQVVWTTRIISRLWLECFEFEWIRARCLNHWFWLNEWLNEWMNEMKSTSSLKWIKWWQLNHLGWESDDEKWLYEQRFACVWHFQWAGVEFLSPECEIAIQLEGSNWLEGSVLSQRVRST